MFDNLFHLVLDIAGVDLVYLLLLLEFIEVNSEIVDCHAHGSRVKQKSD